MHGIFASVPITRESERIMVDADWDDALAVVASTDTVVATLDRKLAKRLQDFGVSVDCSS